MLPSADEGAATTLSMQDSSCDERAVLENGQIIKCAVEVLLTSPPESTVQMQKQRPKLSEGRYTGAACAGDVELDMGFRKASAIKPDDLSDDTYAKQVNQSEAESIDKDNVCKDGVSNFE